MNKSEIDNMDWSHLPFDLSFVPDVLYKILDEDDEKKVDEEIDKLLEVINSESDVYPSTLQISKILVTSLSDKPLNQVERLVEILSRISFHKPLESDLHMEVYQVISSEKTLYRKMLSNFSKKMRLTSNRILSKAVLDVNEVTFCLIEQIINEKDFNLRIQFWHNFSKLLINTPLELADNTQKFILEKINPFLLAETNIEKNEVACIYLLIQQDRVNKVAYTILLNTIRNMSKLEIEDWRIRNHLYVTALNLQKQFKFKFLLQALEITSSPSFASNIVSYLLNEYELINQSENGGNMQKNFNSQQRIFIKALMKSEAFWKNKNVSQILSWARISSTREELQKQLNNSK